MYTFGCCSLSCGVGCVGGRETGPRSWSVHIFSFFLFSPSSRNEESNVSLLVFVIRSCFSLRLPWASLMMPPSLFFFPGFFTGRIFQELPSQCWPICQPCPEFIRKKERGGGTPTEAGCHFHSLFWQVCPWVLSPLLVLRPSIYFYLPFFVRSGGERWRFVYTHYTCQHRFRAILLAPLTCSVTTDILFPAAPGMTDRKMSPHHCYLSRGIINPFPTPKRLDYLFRAIFSLAPSLRVGFHLFSRSFVSANVILILRRRVGGDLFRAL